MKILAIDTTSNCLDWLMRCQQWGHEVVWYDRNRDDGSVRRAGEGIVKKIRDFDALRSKWLGWADLIFLPDNSRFIHMLEPYRQMGYAIFGPGLEATKMEMDRIYGQKVMKDHGIAIMDYKRFDDYDAAAAYVRKHPHMLVSKPSGDADKALSYVAHDMDDMLYMLLDRWKKNPKMRAMAKKDGFILQEKKVGIEMAVGGWYGPGGWSKHIWENWEYKKLMAGDLGPNTGEMGTLARYVRKSKLAEKVLFPIEPLLKKIGYVGYIDNNCIIDEKGNPWPMEWTMRPGWPNFHNQVHMHEGDPAQWMLDLIHGKDTLKVKSNRACVSIVMAIPDFPYSKLTNKEVSGIPIMCEGGFDMDHIHFSEVMIGEAWVKGVRMPNPVTSGDYVLVATGDGETITGARASAYAAVKKIRIPNSPFYRPDIGKGRMVKQLPLLHKLGYATGLEF